MYGVISTGAAWKFLRLTGDVVALDRPDYFIDDLPRIMGILREIVEPRSMALHSPAECPDLANARMRIRADP